MGSRRGLRAGGAAVKWLGENVPTVIGWLGMAAMLLVGAVTQWTLAQSGHAKAVAEIGELEATTTRHEVEIVSIKSDLRSVREQQARMDEVVTRQEGAVRDLEKLTIEIRALVRAKE
jgi:hypothetical protein